MSPPPSNPATTPGRSYHHGDLAQALVDAGMAALRDTPSEDVSLRALARTVGVSQSAVYRHFADKAALLSALARRGLALLAQAQGAASLAAGGGAAGHRATGVAYVTFALDNPHLFRLIFTHTPPEGAVANDETMAMLMRAAVECAPPGVAPFTYAMQSWSLAHGVSMLILDGLVSLTPSMIQAMFDNFPTREP